MKKGEDLESVLLLYDSTRVSNFDINFCKIAEYYGLKCKKIALDTGALTEDLLRDSQGNFFKLIGISADTLLADQAPLEKRSDSPDQICCRNRRRQPVCVQSAFPARFQCSHRSN